MCLLYFLVRIFFVNYITILLLYLLKKDKNYYKMNMFSMMVKKGFQDADKV